ncbi:hypothetical protein WG8_3818 [Paenibacillus sp. Aloe-11]|nr:hypothetical protein WG8_3818 [Paenibacillus sp. Aloe-11]
MFFFWIGDTYAVEIVRSADTIRARSSTGPRGGIGS